MYNLLFNQLKPKIMKLADIKFDELIDVAQKEDERDLLSILYAIKGARCSNTEKILRVCVQAAVKSVLLPLIEQTIIRRN